MPTSPFHCDVSCSMTSATNSHPFCDCSILGGLNWWKSVVRSSGISDTPFDASDDAKVNFVKWPLAWSTCIYCLGDRAGQSSPPEVDLTRLVIGFPCVGGFRGRRTMYRFGMFSRRGWPCHA